MKKTLLALCLALAAPALAVVPSTSSYIDQTGNGATTAFAFTFPVTTSASHVEVLVAGVKQVSGYTVTLNANQTSSPGGTVTFTSAPANAATVRIQRTVPLTQETVYTPYSAFPAKTTERALDRTVYQAQQVDRRVADAEATHAADKATQDSALAAETNARVVADSSLASINIAGAADPNLIAITATGSTTARSLAARFADVVNVKDFGAVGDGVADDYAAFAAAHTALPASGGVIVVPDDAQGYKMGTQFSITKPVELRIGATTLIGPASGWIVDMQTVGGKVVGAGAQATILKLSTGGAGGIRNNDGMRTQYRDFTIDMNSVQGATGFYHYGGWYVSVANVEVPRTGIHSTSKAWSIYSRTLGVAGPTGSWGGAYVSKYENIVGDQMVIDSDGTSTATTITVINADLAHVVLARSRAITFVQPVIQGLAGFKAGVLWDLTDMDGVTVIGGDFERGDYVGANTVYKIAGNVRGLRSIGNLTATLNAGGYSDTYISGAPGDRCYFDDYGEYLTGASGGALRIGSGGTGIQRFRNTGWSVEHHVGIDYSGDTFNVGANLTATSATAGNLTDVSNAGALVEVNTSGQFLFKSASAGANPRTLSTVAKLDGQGWHGAFPLGGDRGDTSQTLTAGSDRPVQFWATTLTANRTVTLSTTGAVNGDIFRVVRTGLGAFTLDVGGLKTVPASTAAFVDVAYNGSAWVLTGYGAL